LANWHLKNVDLYPKNKTAALDRKLFRNPTSEYRGTPFWSWNCRLDRATLLRQIDAMREMGMGGFHMHVRTGMATPYLSDEYMQLIRDCTLKAKAEGMISWLYDEDRWPSGSAGGLVTKDHALRARHLLWTARPYGGKAEGANQESVARGARLENGMLLGRYHVVLKDGMLASYRRLTDDQKAPKNGRIWYAYLEVAGDSSWFNNQGYVDTLNPVAIRKFIEITHDRYAQVVGDHFGSTIPSIFTDEPQFVHKRQFNYAEDVRDVVLPFTDDLFETYVKAYNQRLEDCLPELFWELPENQASPARYRYHDHIAERFALAFADQCGKWCIDHGIALTGHMMDEPTLQSQTGALGEAMRSYRAFQLPGIDMLCDWREYTTAKQAQSAAHQYGRPGVLSELYGVTNWDFDFVGHKAQGDWQAALGVTVRVPHLAWVSMAGEAKRDYPAAIDYHSPWYREYPLVENHFARVNVALTRGQPAVRIGVIHPVESYWLAFGPLQQTKMQRQELEQAFTNVTQWLLFGLADFNFISESLLPELNPKQIGKRFKAGRMAYDAIVVPNMRTIRSTTLDRLEAFAKAGGQIIFAGEVPTLVDAKPSARPMKLARRCMQINLARGSLLNALNAVRDLDVLLADGSRSETILSQMRKDGKDLYLFLCNTDRLDGRENCQIRVRGKWQPTQLDTFSGEASLVSCQHEDGWTVIPWSFAAHGHVLLQLAPAALPKSVPATARPKCQEIARLASPVRVTLSEPNVLLLDQAEWRLGDSEAWQPLEELLRLDNLARTRLCLPARGGGIAQPWTDTATDDVLARLQLRFMLNAEADVAASQLALEELQHASISLDGQPIANNPIGFWVDEAIQTVRLPAMSAGQHELIVTYAFSRKRNIEWMYLLGDFGVRVAGRRATLTAPVRELAFGDYTRQGLPFYAGNVTYHCTIAGAGQPVTLEASSFKAPLLSVDLDGKPAGKIAFAPFRLDLGKMSPGQHDLDITAFGNRVNAFGAVHNADERLTWHGPNAWRQERHNWSYEYQLRRTGILNAPIVYG
jgi:hypothetical protein